MTAVGKRRGVLNLSTLLAFLLLFTGLGCTSSSSGTDRDEATTRRTAGSGENRTSRNRDGSSGTSEREVDPLRVAATTIPDDIEEFEVDGLKVILRKTGSSFRTIFARLTIRGGLPALPDGVSPAFEQMALDVPRFSGPQSMDRAAFQREVDRLHIGLGASAERDYSSLWVRSVDETFDRAWEIFSGTIMNPSFDPVTMENIRERAITGVRNRRVSPEAYANYLADSIFFQGHPYGRVTEEKDYKAITRESLAAYHKSLFQKSRLFLVVVGNVTREEITEKIRGSLGTLPKGSYEDPEVPIPEQASEHIVHITTPYGRRDVPTNYLVVRHLAPGHNDELFYPMDRLRAFVGGMLFRRIRIERNLSYAPGAAIHSHRIGFGDISISTVLPDSAWRVTRDMILTFFRDYIIDESNLTDIPATWYTSQYMGMQTAQSQAEELSAAYFFKGDWREAYSSLEDYLKVTPEQLNAAAQKYYDNFTIVIVGNPATIDPTEYEPPEEEEDEDDD